MRKTKAPLVVISAMHFIANRFSFQAGCSFVQSGFLDICVVTAAFRETRFRSGGRSPTGAGHGQAGRQQQHQTSAWTTHHWSRKVSTVNQSGLFQFVDLQATNFQQRFYRIVSGQ